MHRAIPRVVFEHLRRHGATVLDPFCGGGTVLVEARAAGWRGLGVDLNPLALRLTEVKSAARSAPDRRRFVAEAEAVGQRSEARVRGRVPIVVDLPRSEIRWYAPHVLKELGGLREEIRAVERFDDRRALAMVLSSILVKVSRQRADTAQEAVERRIRKGLATEIFVRKAREVAERWRALAEVARGPAPRLWEADARELPRVLGRRRVDLVLSSPPYGGTYDYAAHHARRIAFLGLDDRTLRELEIGARRSLNRPAAGERWDRQMSDVLHAMRRVLHPGGWIVLVVGDAELGGRRVPALTQLKRLASPLGLELVASASQPRAGHASGRPREEHLVALRAS